MTGSGDNSNDPFEKGDPLKNKNYNKVFWQYSLAVIVILAIGLLFLYIHGRHI